MLSHCAPIRRGRNLKYFYRFLSAIRKFQVMNLSILAGFLLLMGYLKRRMVTRYASIDMIQAGTKGSAKLVDFMLGTSLFTHNCCLVFLPYGWNRKTNIMGYWSSSPNANNSNNAWIVNFNNGNDNTNNKNNNYVRLVRSGEWHDRRYHL